MANCTLLPHVEKGVETFIPKHIFPKPETPIAGDIEVLQKISRFNNGDIKPTFVHQLSTVSEEFRQRQLANVKSYLIDVDCFCENRIKEIVDITRGLDAGPIFFQIA